MKTLITSILLLIASISYSQDYTIVQIADGKEVQSGSVKAFTGYAQSGSNVAILAASNDAYDRLMIQLADKVLDALILIQPQAKP